MRELLDPAPKATPALPEDEDLAADLTTPRYPPATGAKIIVEPEDDIACAWVAAPTPPTRWP
jgi:hypothetical protein